MKPRAGGHLGPPLQTKGFSLIEVMIVIGLIGIIMTIVLPAGRDAILQSRLTTQANGLVSDILYARNEASTRGLNVVMCPSANGTTCTAANTDWAVSRYIFIDTNGNNDRDAGEERLKLATRIPANMTITPSGFTSTTRIGFNSSGGLLPLGSSGAFKLCASDATSGREVKIGINGRPSSTRVTCP